MLPTTRPLKLKSLLRHFIYDGKRRQALETEYNHHLQRLISKEWIPMCIIDGIKRDRKSCTIFRIYVNESRLGIDDLESLFRERVFEGRPSIGSVIKHQTGNQLKVVYKRIKDPYTLEVQLSWE
jgi:hypothetical protein